jgi:hypothetical protein
MAFLCGVGVQFGYIMAFLCGVGVQFGYIMVGVFADPDESFQLVMPGRWNSVLAAWLRKCQVVDGVWLGIEMLGLPKALNVFYSSS